MIPAFEFERERAGKSASSCPKANPNPLYGEKGYTDDGLKAKGAAKNITAVQIRTDGWFEFCFHQKEIG